MANALIALVLLLLPSLAFAQVDGRQVIVSPDGTREAEVAGSTNDALKVVCVDGSCAGGGGGTQDVNIVEVGGNAVTTTVPISGTVTAVQPTGTNLHVVCDSGCSGGATVSTVTDTLDALNDTITLELNGAAGVSASFPDFNGFDGTVIFQVSNDGGTGWRQVQANTRLRSEVSHDLLADPQPSNQEWVFALGGGETHARVLVTAYTSGTVDVTMTGAAVPSNILQSVMFPSTGGNRPQAALMIGGQDISAGSARPPVVYNFNDATSSYGMIVRDMQGGFRVGQGMTGALDFGKAIGGIFSDDTYRFAEMRDADPASNEVGLVVRNIPSGTQVVSAVNLDIRDLVFATDKVDVSGSTLAFDSIEVSDTITALSDSVVLDVTGKSALMMELDGPLAPWSGDIAYQASYDGGTTWFDIALYSNTYQKYYMGSAATVFGFGLFERSIAGLTHFRVISTAWTSGSLSVKIRATTGTLAAQLPLGDPNSIAEAIPVTIASGSVVSTNATLINGSGIQTGNGAVGIVGTQRVTIANDSTGVLASVGSITNALPAGNNNIGDVDVASVVPGTGATNLGKAEDGGHTTADVGVFILGVRNDGGSTQTTSANTEYAQVSVDAYGAAYARPDHPNRVSCNVSSTATTSAIVTGCSAPGAGLSIYLTSLQWHSSIISTTTNFMTIQSGTGGNCGASVDVLYRGYAQVAFSGREVVFQTPIKAPANEEICLLHPGAGTRLVNIQGFIAP